MYGSIENYVWGVRVWMQSQMVVDPIMGVLFWPNFMQAIASFDVLEAGDMVEGCSIWGLVRVCGFEPV